MEALGRLLNIVPTADGVEVALTHASAVTFVCVGASQDYTVQEASDAAGTGATNLAVVDRWYTNTSAAGAAAWAEQTRDTPGAAVTAGASDAAVVIHVSATQLSDGFTYVRCSSSSTGLVYAIVHDLHVQRAPHNLPALAV